LHYRHTFGTGAVKHARAYLLSAYHVNSACRAAVAAEKARALTYKNHNGNTLQGMPDQNSHLDKKLIIYIAFPFNHVIVKYARRSRACSLK
jgi:hypothetical protein